MSPEVTAAVIAASVSFLTLIGTLVAQLVVRRDTQKALEDQREQLDKTLKAQSDQLDKTLAEQRTRTLNERFAAAAGQLGDDKPPAVRLAGVYAMAGLADDWEENRQTCIDVLCSYLRLPYDPDPGDGAGTDVQSAYQASREVRHTVIRVITAHLKDDAAASWRGFNFDFTGVIFDGGDFTGASFTGGQVSFAGAGFARGEVRFTSAAFSGGTVSFYGAKFTGSQVRFDGAVFTSPAVSFYGAQFAGGTADFSGAHFTGGEVRFGNATFSGGTVRFADAAFTGGTVSFRRAAFSGGTVSFRRAAFSGGTVGFYGAKFAGGQVGFTDAAFSGSTVSFSAPADWSFPPAFPWTGLPPSGVKLPKKEDLFLE